MNYCASHSNILAMTSCQQCGRPVCAICVGFVDRQPYCASDYAATMGRSVDVLVPQYSGSLVSTLAPRTDELELSLPGLPSTRYMYSPRGFEFWKRVGWFWPVFI